MPLVCIRTYVHQQKNACIYILVLCMVRSLNFQIQIGQLMHLVFIDFDLHVQTRVIEFDWQFCQNLSPNC